MQQFEPISSSTVILSQANIDTDQIIPARFLKITDTCGLGEQAFADWRYDRNGQPIPSSPLNQPGARSAKVLVAGDNFGCGSSREHAAWALLGFGFRVVISTSFGEIFRNNAMRNGLLPVQVSPAFHQTLCLSPGATVQVDLQEQTVQVNQQVERFDIEPFARYCLLSGQDHLDYLLSLESHISAFEEVTA